jgi:hypothetical protein
MTTSNPTLPLPTIGLRKPRTLKSCNAAIRSIEATEVAPDKEEKETCLTSLKNGLMQKYEWFKITSKYIPLRLRLFVFVIEKKQFAHFNLFTVFFLNIYKSML